MLELEEVDTGYGKKQILFGISLKVYQGEIVALIGSNGSGKSTTLKVTFGLLPTWKGRILIAGVPTQETSPTDNIIRGMSFAPQGGRVFDNLTVLENLELGGLHLRKTLRRQHIEKIFHLFPLLAERSQDIAGNLSGGQQQTLALGRSLVCEPTILLLDEPSLGLSPNGVSATFEQISQINRQLGTTILIVEQKVRAVLNLCDRVYGLKLGKCVFCQTPDELRTHDDRLKKLFL
ncbi:MAG: ABC transporter ATP-binding protein [Okeania sp. SIO2D1]|nr:ABC transporter ATP-binding protein [Okeania sp. SIO2D1]